MTNREKWMPKIIDDRIIEESICHKFVGSMTELGDFPKCPIEALCKRFVIDGGLTESEYMEAVSEWFDEEVKDDGSV